MPTAPAYESLPEPAGDSLPVRRALISVADKTAAADFAAGLAKLGVEIVSTGGTATVLEEAGVDVRPVEDLTGFPEILDGRVKTLHPHLYAALLAVRDNPEHAATLSEREIEPIDLVCVNLYPFERTIARYDVPEEEAIEQIDIGGPTMIRAAAKNHRFIAVVVKPESYDAVLGELEEMGELSAADAPLARQRGLRLHRAIRRRDQPLVRAPLRDAAPALGHLLGEGAGPDLRREPPPAGGALRRVGGALARALAGGEAARQAACRSTTCWTWTPRGGSAPSSRGPGA